GYPIIGYSNYGQYVVPNKGNEVDFWMQKRKNEIISIRSQNLTATPEVTDQWNSYINNVEPKLTKKATHKMASSIFPSSSQYLVQSGYDQQYQPFPYNWFCPPAGNAGSTSSNQAVTGCVATTMTQIMRYWEYPKKGTGSSSYAEATYGTLSANYAHTYNWAAMPLKPATYSSPSATPDTNIARAMSDNGISVEMSYSPTGSGAYVITADDPNACAQISYVKYFGYSSKILDGLNGNATPTTAWVDTLEHELDCSRPIQYVGQSSAGGHTWVCDGYDASNNFHMNWGWSNVDDGWYALNNLQPSSGELFNTNIEALIGIMPPGLLPNFTATPTSGCAGMKVTFTDATTGSTTPASWSWSFPGGSPSTYSGKTPPAVTYSSAGSYTVTEVVTDGSGNKDTAKKASFIIVGPSTGATLPLVETFQTSTFAPTGWVINNPAGHSTTWALSTSCGGFGKSTQCMYYNNCTGGISGNYDQIYTPAYNFTSIAKPEIYFDVAYAPYNTTESDTLAVYYSLDCGTTWKNVYLKGGIQLGTYGGDYTSTTTCFLPTSTQWRTDTIKIPAIVGKSDVMFSFENRSGNGFSMYIDNINIPGSPTGISNISAEGTVSVYPNPNNGSFTVEMNNVQDKQQLTVYNVLGQQVYGAVLNQEKTSISLNTFAGIYFYRIISLDGNKMVSEGKLIVK
ncbi:MAG TPA: C10 family peptidase, partial [Bacteroidia bacterium]|nr:C10 family peptidase [Bacteroidia bacterium]